MLKNQLTDTEATIYNTRDYDSEEYKNAVASQKELNDEIKVLEAALAAKTSKPAQNGAAVAAGEHDWRDEKEAAMSALSGVITI